MKTKVPKTSSTYRIKSRNLNDICANCQGAGELRFVDREGFGAIEKCYACGGTGVNNNTPFHFGNNHKE